MIYLVTKNTQLFQSPNYSVITVGQSLKIIESWEIVQYDSETSGRDPHICDLLCVQFGNKAANIQIVVDTTTINIKLYKYLLETKLLIGHNLKFDIEFLYKYEIVPRHVWDTMIIEQLLHLGFDNKYFHYSLKDVAERRLNVIIDKTVRGEIIWRGLDDSVIIYAAGDVVYLEDIRDQQLKECKEQDCLVGASIENAFVPVIAYLEWCGIRLDVDKWKKKMEHNEQQKQEAIKHLDDWVVSYRNKLDLNTIKNYCIREDNHGFVQDLTIPVGWKPCGIPFNKTDEFGIKYEYVPCKRYFPYVNVNLQGDLFSGIDETPHCTINWSSSKQVLPFVQLLGFNTETVDKKTGATKHSVDEKTLSKQKGIEDEFLKYYFEYQEATKVCSTYGQNFLDCINPITGRIHTTFKQLGASSGRMTSGNSKQNNIDLAKLKKLPANRVSYPNLQNLPADDITRSSFVSGPGNLLVSADFSALESRLGADIYNEQSMIDEYLYGSGDIHSLVAKKCFPKELKDIDVKDIKDIRPDLRKKAKAPEFAKQFGGSYKAIMNSLGCSTLEAKDIERSYEEGFPGIKTFQEKGSHFVRTHGYILICAKTGHKIYWEDWKKWREIEDMPEALYYRECTAEERKEHSSAAAKWDRLALNSPTQGSGIIILKLAMISFFNYILKKKLFNKVLLCNLIHDESVVEYPEYLTEIPQILKKCMEKAASIICTKVPIPSVPEVGTYWIH